MAVEEIGFIENGTGKHQSNTVYGTGGGISRSDSKHCEKPDHDFRYGLCGEYAYCIDANYTKGTSFELFVKKHRRQLIIERIYGEQDISSRKFKKNKKN